MTSTDLEIHEPRQMAVLTNEQLQYIANTEFVPQSLRGNLPAILACVATGRSLGIADMSALRSIHIIDGKATFSAELMVQLVRRDGHSIQGEVTDGAATVTGKRADTGDTMTSTWTLAMAERAGLLNKGNWKKYPEAMLWARAVSQLCRMLFADCFSGNTYTPEELEDTATEVETPPFAGAAPDTPNPSCDYCGSLHWTLDTYKRLTHKCGCPHRTDDFCQAHPELCDAFTDVRVKESAGPPHVETLKSGGLCIYCGKPAGEPGPCEKRPAEWQQKTALAGETFEDIFECAPDMVDESAGLASAGEPQAREYPDAASDEKPSPAVPAKKATAAQKKKLDVLVGTLRDAGRVHTTHLYLAVEQMRGEPPLEGLAPDEELHWAPLRDTLSKDEATNLIDRLQKLEAAE